MAKFFKIINHWVFVLRHPFQVYCKARQLILLQSAMVCYYKVWLVLLQSATGITKCDNFITKCHWTHLHITDRIYRAHIDPSSWPHIYPLPFLTAQLHLSGVRSLGAKHPACIYSATEMLYETRAASLFARTGACATSCFRMFAYRSFS